MAGDIASVVVGLRRAYVRKRVRVRLFDESQPRDEYGRWTDGAGGPGAGAREAPGNVAPREGKYRPRDVHDAVEALASGKHIEFEQPRELSTFLDRLAEIAADAHAKGEKAPTYDLCKVSVANTNLFCSESKGISRLKMPQLIGKPEPGSKGDRYLQKDEKGEINLGEQFRSHLLAKGVAVDDAIETAAFLRASQNELNGAKVAGIMKAMVAGKIPEAAIFVSRDNYVIDGHHRWAAKVGVDVLDNHLGDVSMPVARIDMPILEVLVEANKFAADWGVGSAGV